MSELEHHGVKGMKWGKRRAELNKPNAGYTKGDRARDSFVHPAGSIKRINRRMNKGADLKTARRKEGQRTLLKTAAIVAIYKAPKIIDTVDGLLSGHGANTMSNIRQKAQTNRGRASAAATMGLPRTATNGPSYATKGKKTGVYNISSL